MATTLQFSGVERVPQLGALAVVHLPRSGFFTQLESDISDVFLNESEFAEPVQITFLSLPGSVTVSALFDNPAAHMSTGDPADFQTLRPQVRVQESKLPQPPTAKNTRVRVRGVDYLVEDVISDGVGTTLLYLKRK